MQAFVAAPCGWAEERYEVDYEGKREENPWSGFWWGWWNESIKKRPGATYGIGSITSAEAENTRSDRCP